MQGDWPKAKSSKCSRCMWPFLICSLQMWTQPMVTHCSLCLLGAPTNTKVNAKILSSEKNTELLLVVHGREATSPLLMFLLTGLWVAAVGSLLPSPTFYDPIQLPVSPANLMNTQWRYALISDTLPPSLGSAGNCHHKAANLLTLKVSKVNFQIHLHPKSLSPVMQIKSKCFICLKRWLSSASPIQALDAGLKVKHPLLQIRLTSIQSICCERSILLPRIFFSSATYQASNRQM